MSYPTKPPQINGVDPEFVDVRGMRDRFGITRTLAYSLMNEGYIRGVSLRRPGRAGGKRLFVVDSVRKYLGGVAGDQPIERIEAPLLHRAPLGDDEPTTIEFDIEPIAKAIARRVLEIITEAKNAGTLISK